MQKKLPEINENNLVEIVKLILEFNQLDQEGSDLRILTPSQMLSGLPISLAQLEARNNSGKLNNEIRQILYPLNRSEKLTKQIGRDHLNMETTFMNTENSTTNESNKVIYQFADKLNLKSRNNKNIGLVNLSIYYTQKNIKTEYNSNKFKISSPTWNDTFDLPDGSYSISDIQDYFEFIIKRHETLTENPTIQIYPNKIKNRTDYILELLSPEMMKLSESPKNMLIKIKMEIYAKTRIC